jgi:hypothetical protein
MSYQNQYTFKIKLFENKDRKLKDFPPRIEFVSVVISFAILLLSLSISRKLARIELVFTFFVCLNSIF